MSGDQKVQFYGIGHSRCGPILGDGSLFRVREPIFCLVPRAQRRLATPLVNLAFTRKQNQTVAATGR